MMYKEIKTDFKKYYKGNTNNDKARVMYPLQYFSFFLLAMTNKESIRFFLGTWFVVVIILIFTIIFFYDFIKPKQYWLMTDDSLDFYVGTTKKQSVKLNSVKTFIDNHSRIFCLRVYEIRNGKLVKSQHRLKYNISDYECNNFNELIEDLQTKIPNSLDDSVNLFQAKNQLHKEQSSNQGNIISKLRKLNKITFILFFTLIILNYNHTTVHFNYYLFAIVVGVLLFIPLEIYNSWRKRKVQDKDAFERKVYYKYYVKLLLPMLVVFVLLEVMQYMNEYRAIHKLSEPTIVSLKLTGNYEDSQGWQLPNSRIKRQYIYDGELNYNLEKDITYQVIAYKGFLGDLVVPVESLKLAKVE